MASASFTRESSTYQLSQYQSGGGNQATLSGMPQFQVLTVSFTQPNDNTARVSIDLPGVVGLSTSSDIIFSPVSITTPLLISCPVNGTLRLNNVPANNTGAALVYTYKVLIFQ